jgi:4-hydroxy-2-oxoheptanedioate aldolase
VAARRIQQGWEFVNCGADVAAIMGWIPKEMAKLNSLIESRTKEEHKAKDVNSTNGYS